MVKYVDDLRLVVNSHRDDRITISTHDVLALLGEYSALESRLAELEKDAARYRWIRGADGLTLELLDMVNEELDEYVDAKLSREA